MNSMDRDPVYIAEQMRFLRKAYNLTQENLADMAGLTTRTIEKVESGRHRPDEQTLRSIARAMGIEVRYFIKPTPAQEAQQKAFVERALRTMVLVETSPIHTASNFLHVFDQRHAFRFDTSAVTDDAALETAAAMVDWITDLNDVWIDCSMSHRLEFAHSFAQLCSQIENKGFVCHMGNHKQQLREKDRPLLVFSVGLMTFLPKDQSHGMRYALVQLEGQWESMEADRVPLP